MVRAPFLGDNDAATVRSLSSGSRYPEEHLIGRTSWFNGCAAGLFVGIGILYWTGDMVGMDGPN